MANFQYDAHFRQFAKSLQDLLLGEGGFDDEFTKKQKEQVENLVKLEKEFKKILLAHCRGLTVYKKFINFIWQSGKDHRRNTLVARPYFRERQSNFSKGISPAIQKRKFKKLSQFSINFPFIVFALNCINWPPKSKIRKAAKAVQVARNQIIQQNMPLAISRARIFRQKTPESHLSYMDLVQISMEGLVNAVDKFVPPYTTVFRSVIIGRIVGDLIDNYSEKMIHFYPSDKRKIYRANKAQKHQIAEDYESLARTVNSGPELENPTNSGEIHQLLMASSHFSMDTPTPEQGQDKSADESTLSDKYPEDEDNRPDVVFENNELRTKLYEVIKTFTILENKFLKMKGIQEQV
jgi:RNA polymerase sigma factor (sigma-70 family)